MNPHSSDSSDSRDPSGTALSDLDFQEPWADLKQRLLDAIDNLNSLRASTSDESDKERLSWKREGVDDAYEAWSRLTASIADGELNHNRAWVRFTDQVSYLYNVHNAHPGYHQGIGLALSYQRGYGAGIDAPIIINPHLEA